jgi:hypothetical protein
VLSLILHKNFFGSAVGYSTIWVHSSATVLRCDNRSAIQIAHNDVFHNRTKHIEIYCHFVRQHVARGTGFIGGLTFEGRVVGSGGERLKIDQARDAHFMLDFSKVEFKRKGAINESISESLSVSLAPLASSVRE